MTLARAFAPPISNVSMHKITTNTFVSRLVGFATKGNKSAVGRAKSALLPDIQSCQNGIFNELRAREALRAAAQHKPAPYGNPTLAEGLRLRLGQFFTNARTVH